MPSSSLPAMDCEQHFPLLPVTNITEAVAFYTSKLGFSTGFIWGEPPTMAGVNLDKVSLHLSNQPPAGTGNTSVYFIVGNADELYDLQVSNGVTVVEPLADRPYGMRDYSIRDPYGNFLAFGHNHYRTGPPIEIERVAVPLRLEKRLAAVLEDLAKHKGMSIDSCLEETLLHTFEPFGDGVASPHTQRTIRFIQELKKKHGIDYDSHGSYQFVEKT